MENLSFPWDMKWKPRDLSPWR